MSYPSQQHELVHESDFRCMFRCYHIHCIFFDGPGSISVVGRSTVRCVPTYSRVCAPPRDRAYIPYTDVEISSGHVPNRSLNHPFLTVYIYPRDPRSRYGLHNGSLLVSVPWFHPTHTKPLPLLESEDLAPRKHRIPNRDVRLGPGGDNEYGDIPDIPYWKIELPIHKSERSFFERFLLELFYTCQNP